MLWLALHSRVMVTGGSVMVGEVGGGDGGCVMDGYERWFLWRGIRLVGWMVKVEWGRCGYGYWNGFGTG